MVGKNELKPYEIKFNNLKSKNKTEMKLKIN